MDKETKETKEAIESAKATLSILKFHHHHKAKTAADMSFHKQAVGIINRSLNKLEKL